MAFCIMWGCVGWASYAGASPQACRLASLIAIVASVGMVGDLAERMDAWARAKHQDTEPVT